MTIDKNFKTEVSIVDFTDERVRKNNTTLYLKYFTLIQR